MSLFYDACNTLDTNVKPCSLSLVCTKTLNFKAAADGIPWREVHICHSATSPCLTYFKIAFRPQRLLKDEPLKVKPQKEIINPCPMLFYGHKTCFKIEENIMFMTFYFTRNVRIL
jgi:hypothetical protein